MSSDGKGRADGEAKMEAEAKWAKGSRRYAAVHPDTRYLNDSKELRYFQLSLPMDTLIVTDLFLHLLLQAVNKIIRN